MLASSIDIHTYIVDYAFYRLLEAVAKFSLIHIVLVLSDSYGLGFYFYQFRQGINKPPTYTNSPTNRNIFIGKLVTCDLTGRINRCPGFANYKDLRCVLPLCTQCIGYFSRHLLGFAAGSTITDGNCFYPVFLNQFLQAFRTLQIMQEEHIVKKQVSLFV